MVDYGFVAKSLPRAGLKGWSGVMSPNDYTSRAATSRGGPIVAAADQADNIKRAVLAAGGNGSRIVAAMAQRIADSLTEAAAYERSLLPRGGPTPHRARHALIGALAIHWRWLGHEPRTGQSSQFVAFVEAYAAAIGWTTDGIPRAVEKALKRKEPHSP
jgi:hypothetical protein